MQSRFDHIQIRYLDPFYFQGLVKSASGPGQTHNCIHVKQWDANSHPSPNFNDVLVKLQLMGE